MFKKKKLYKITFDGSASRNTAVIAARDEIQAVEIFYNRHSSNYFYVISAIELYKIGEEVL